MSHKEPMLYRAPENAGAPNAWKEDHFIRLGPLASFQSQLATIITGLVLVPSPQENMAAGQGIFNGLPILVTVHLDPGSGDVIWFGLANCGEPLLLDQLKKQFGVKAFDFESCEFI